MDTQYPPLKDHLFDSLTNRILVLGWMIYVIFAPIYLFESGLPQPADLIIFITAGVTIILFILKTKLLFNRVFTSLALMAALFFTINTVNYNYYGDIRFFYSSLYYIFNAFIFGSTVILFKNDPQNMLSKARIAVIASLVLQMAWILLFDSNSDYRETGSFNNPNQLGYWAMLSSCYLLIINYGRRMPWIDVLGILICTYFISESLSRATIISYALILIVFFIGPYMNMLTRIALLVLFSAYALFQIAVLNNAEFLIRNFDKIERVVERLESVQSEDGLIEERGYERLLNYPQYILYGAGEGAHWRFNAKARIQDRGLEVHSGLAAILLGYGLLGFSLFSIFVLTIFQRVPPILWVTLAAIMAYGITHQHIRFSGFWVYLGLIYAVSRYIIPHLGRGFFHPPQPHRPLSLTKTNEDRATSNPV